ncbi:hypothetical protein OBBRIDRAFT_837256 [Obba rivulosa]|uniref:Uncharacterized protein n=1 Tax=Obba rivulosa TaxID=1052685 RepID=A0A8E2AY59_9APHY|nr:hypothetical protein OBBRIDRAFT_837256 [Obba rivulosa]
MAATFTTDSRSSRDRRDPVPLLLSEFPAPPSFIPPSPYTPLTPSGSNPPPSLPPSSPLPPVPGPSPISEHDTLLFMNAARSRRASKLSVASSSYSRRDSTATLASVASGSNASLPSLSPSGSTTPLESSARSLRSSPSNGSLAVRTGPRHVDISPVIAPSICEEDPADLTRMSLDELSLHSSLPDHDLSDDEKLLEYGIAPSISRRRPRSGGSAASHGSRELPTVREDEPGLSRAASPLMDTPLPPRRSRSGSLAPPLGASVDKALPPLPADAPPPRSAPADVVSLSRADSPDIQRILATTPRARRKSSSSLASSRSASRPRSSARPAMRRHVSEDVAPASVRAQSVGSSCRTSSRRTSETMVTRSTPVPLTPSELPYVRTAEAWGDESLVEDYGTPLDATGTAYDMLDGDAELRLERQLDGEGSDSDSSLDIHTPLPHLMLRDGLLSPNSKLLGQASSPIHPQMLPNSRPGSMASVVSTTGSVMTKSGIFKDERNTEKRRHRHRDGKLLRGGIGLTTGLGWSDSEDEDAPSPLTRRLSSRTLGESAQASSSRSPHPSSRSVSEGLSSSSAGPSKYGALSAGATLPPHSTGTLGGSSLERRTSSSSVGSSASSALGLRSRSSVSSLRSASSSGRRALDATPRVGFPLSHIHEREEANETSSSTSSVSMPVTPSGHDSGGLPRYSSAMPRLRKSSADSSLHSPLSDHISRTATSFSSTEASTHVASPPPASRISVPRPLRLPQAQASGRYNSTPAPPPSSYTPVSGSTRIRTYSGGLQRPQHFTSSTSQAESTRAQAELSPVSSSSMSSASSPNTVAAVGAPPTLRKKPRTGTGMTYRTSSNPTLRPTMMRMPSSSALRASATKGVGVAM